MVVVRLFNTVGPRQTGQYGMVLPTFVRQALAGQPITVFGDGTQSRSFTYVADVVDALIKLAHEPRAVGEVFNIGNTEEVSIGALAAAGQGADRQRARRSSSSPTTRPTRPASRTCRAGCPTSPRSHALVGYEPRMGLDDIIRTVIEHFRQR